MTDRSCDPAGKDAGRRPAVPPSDPPFRLQEPGVDVSCDETVTRFAASVPGGGNDLAAFAFRVAHQQSAERGVHQPRQSAQSGSFKAFRIARAEDECLRSSKHEANVQDGWRRRRDSNPRDPLEVCALSRGVPSTTRPHLRLPVYRCSGAGARGKLGSWPIELAVAAWFSLCKKTDQQATSSG
jgi:hypothetical protein